VSLDLETQLRQYTDHIVERVDTDATIGHHLAPIARPERRLPVRGVLVALGSAIAVLLVALPLLISGSDETVTPRDGVTSTTLSGVVPTPMPDIGSWEWHRIDGTDENVPGGQMFTVDNRLMVVDDVCPASPEEGADCPPPSYWWESPDGLTWNREPLPEDLAGYVLSPIRAHDGAWLLGTDASGQQAIFFHLGDGWTRVDLTEPLSAWPLVATRGTTVLVVTDDRLVVSDDLGVNWEPVDVPWLGEASAVVSTSEGFVAYVLSNDRIEIWFSEGGRSWELVDSPAPLGGAGVQWLIVAGRPDSHVVAGAETTDTTPHWVSDDGLSWSRIEELEGVFDSPDVYLADFGFVMMGFAASRGSPDDLMLVMVSEDGSAWDDVSDPRVSFGPDESPLTLAPSVAADRVFVALSRDNGARTLWIGGFDLERGN